MGPFLFGSLIALCKPTLSLSYTYNVSYPMPRHDWPCGNFHSFQPHYGYHFRLRRLSHLQWLHCLRHLHHQQETLSRRVHHGRNQPIPRVSPPSFPCFFFLNAYIMFQFHKLMWVLDFDFSDRCWLLGGQSLTSSVFLMISKSVSVFKLGWVYCWTLVVYILLWYFLQFGSSSSSLCFVIAFCFDTI